MDGMILTRFISIDQALVEQVKDIKLLGSLSWPQTVQSTFLKQWHAGKPRLPKIQYPLMRMQDKIKQLEKLLNGLEDTHPLGRYLRNTIYSYIATCRLLDNLGSAEVCRHSIALYGKPGDTLTGSEVHNIDAARHFIEVADEYNKTYALHETEYCLSAETLRAELSAKIDAFFHAHKVKVIIDPSMVSKAAAGPFRIRLRGGASFSEYDLEQLLEHEAFIHSLTAINGLEQKHFKSLGLNAPRTTGTQEGLATFAELVTGSIDINRMERIALRIIAIDMALNGADFIEVFRYFIDAGQAEVESFNSTMRVFRGVPLTGGHAFTKDTVYLHGLMSIHTFFRWALKHQKLKLCRYLFAGRMTINDVIELETFFDDQTLSSPFYLPPWMQRGNGLAGYLAFSVFANKIKLGSLDGDYDFSRSSDVWPV